ncbi:MAG: hypothetical protein R3E10_07940 [Gemmatimonadota bacterium]
MARHNRTAKGVDQRDQSYGIDYQPDWLRRVRVTRKLANGRQSTMNLFRNPVPHRQAEPGTSTRTAIQSADGAIDFSIQVTDPRLRVRSVTVSYELDAPAHPGRRRSAAARGEVVVFTLEDGLKPAPPR